MVKMTSSWAVGRKLQSGAALVRLTAARQQRELLHGARTGKERGPLDKGVVGFV